ncbi:DUF4132 domain-containing protein [cf. Phormidesmis sp. LEGE 11477]|uniref:DUF4132 domain-containing protein n=1 Tax=cf. Phormidesmis sp. LEGE 11477 TaxID=1828680 RepID=UPI001881C0E1|nr:DUF4132 domain-containing protein [cf. Phormidesmis sp. LEGE 11477]MBE9060978.1 DUF4132 domain-containing protein [cf. Phormidesmis sp. LEGE 11477]
MSEDATLSQEECLALIKEIENSFFFAHKCQRKLVDQLRSGSTEDRNVLIKKIENSFPSAYEDCQKLADQLRSLSPKNNVILSLEIKRWYRRQIETDLPRVETDETKGRRQGVDSISYVLHDMARITCQKLPFTYPQVMEWLSHISSLPLSDKTARHASYVGISVILNHYLEAHPLTLALQESIERIYTNLDASGSVLVNDLDGYAWKAGLYVLTSIGLETMPQVIRTSKSDLAAEYVRACPIEVRAAWVHLLNQCNRAPGSKPSKTWLKAVSSELEIIGKDSFVRALLSWLPLVEQQPIVLNEKGRNSFYYNSYIFKWLMWLGAEQNNAELAQAIGSLANAAYSKNNEHGSRRISLGNVCVMALGRMQIPQAVEQLSLLKAKVKFTPAQKQIEKALTQVAEREGLTWIEIEEMSVPTYGLTEVGILRETLGDYTAELRVRDTNRVVISWIRPDGKSQKSVPKAVKDHSAEALKNLKQTVKELRRMLPVQRDRIESIYLQPRTWDFATWRSRYLDHPLVGTLARRLLWQFESGTEEKETSHTVGIWQTDRLVNLEGQPISELDDTTRVSLWHPITSDSETIQAWRRQLWEYQIQQPFKQAHREVYLLTPAEEATRTYSNRFAAHILKQHQFKALCDRRGWRYSLQLMIDCNLDSSAVLMLPHWDLQAKFRVEGVGEEYGEDSTDAGTFWHVATDHTSFQLLNSPAAIEPLGLSNIPAIVFTEAMRDIDLFVGVASVGNDPNWIDSGNRHQHQTYWHSYSFGDLSATAKTRRQALENLVPKLKKIRDRCSFQDRFLIVKGDIRTYKIHLGSSNILMEPNDQYLCIVRSHNAHAESFFLPFEGDKTLSLILSKAFLLADDANIKDETIVQQIQRGLA